MSILIKNKVSYIKSHDKRSKLFQLFFGGKRFLINPDFQFKFIAHLLSITFGFMIVIVISQLIFFQIYYNKGQELGLSENHSFFQILMEQQQTLLICTLIGGAIILFASFFWGLFYSHRIAGPLYRLERTFKDSSQKGDLPSYIQFREDDFFQEIPEAINQYLKSHSK